MSHSDTRRARLSLTSSFAFNIPWHRQKTIAKSMHTATQKNGRLAAAPHELPLWLLPPLESRSGTSPSRFPAHALVLLFFLTATSLNPPSTPPIAAASAARAAAAPTWASNPVPARPALRVMQLHWPQVQAAHTRQADAAAQVGLLRRMPQLR